MNKPLPISAIIDATAKTKGLDTKIKPSEKNGQISLYP